MLRHLICLALVAASCAFASPVALKSALSKQLHSVVRDAVPAGLRLGLSQNGASYLVGVAFPAIISRLSGLTIPEVQGQTSVPLLGTITYTLTNIKIGTVTYTSDSVSLQGGFQAALTGLTVPVSLGWEFRQNSWPHIDSSGTADAQITDASLALSLSFTADSTGHPQLSVQNVVANFDDISIKVHGSVLSWLYDLLFAVFKSTIKKDAAQMVQNEITQMVDVMADQAFSKLDLAVPITNLTQIDLFLTQNPQFPSDSVTVSLRGQIENRTNPSPCPVPHATLPTAAPSKMIEVDVDGFLFNSGLWLIYGDGGLSYTVTQAQIPPEIGFTLNTSTFQALVPTLYQAYPNAGIEWGFSAAAQPVIDITPAGCGISAAFNMDWLAGYPPQPFVSAFTALVELELDCFFTLNSTDAATVLQGNMSLSHFAMNISADNIGPIDPTLLQSFFSAIFGGPVVTMINQIIEAGFPLPVVGGMSLQNAQLSLQDGYIAVNSDLHLQLPQSMLDALDQHVAARPAVAPRRTLHFDVLQSAVAPVARAAISVN